MQEKTGIELTVSYALFYPLLHFFSAIGLSLLIILAYMLIGRMPVYYEPLFILILIIRGFLFIRIPYFILLNNELLIMNRFGKTQKKYAFENLKDFHFENKKLFLLVNGKYKKIRVNSIFISSKNWQKLRSIINASDLSKELH